jgi:hypothetical protein
MIKDAVKVNQLAKLDIETYTQLNLTLGRLKRLKDRSDHCSICGKEGIETIETVP